MPDIYLSSVDGSDSDDGSTWALAKATLAAALTAAGAGGTVYVDNAHAESQASQINLTSPGTAASPARILCVDRTGDPEPPTALATTATVTTTGANDIVYAGCAYVYGITFTAGSGTAVNRNAFISASAWEWIFEQCSLVKGGTGGAATALTIGGTGTGFSARLILIDTTLVFGNTSDQIFNRIEFYMYGGSIAATGAVPTTLFTGNNQIFSLTRLFGVDLSAFGSGKNLVNVAIAGRKIYELINCKLGASVAAITGTIVDRGGASVRIVNSDSGDTNYRYEKYEYQGSIVQETTIVRTGGASDGTTPVSREMVSLANASIQSPLESDPIIIWNETTGSAVTVTVETVTDNVTLTDKEAWIEVEYLGTSGFPLSLFESDRADGDDALLGSGTNQDSSSETWTTTGLTTPVKQKLSVSFTPQEKGPIRVRVMLAKASTTMYFCPKVDIS